MSLTITPGTGPVEAAAALFDRSWPAGARPPQGGYLLLRRYG